MSFPTSFSSLQIHSFSSRKGFGARRPSSIYTTAPSSPTSTLASPPLQPSPSASPSAASVLSEVPAASSVPDAPLAAKGPFFESRRFSRRLPILSRKSSSLSASTTDALHTRSASVRSVAPSSPQLSPSNDDRLASAEIRPRASSETTGSSPATAQEHTKPALSSRSVPKPPARPAANDRSQPALADDKRRKLVRNLSKVEHSPDRRGKLAAATQPEKMHQTSSRLLRMTDDDRPFTRDFKDLFSTLMVSLPLTSHRVRFRQIDHTFTSEEAITNLGSLKFSQSNRMPDPKDPSRIVTTTTTTTFSMAKEMARSVCQKFLDARFIESADGKMDFASKSAVWQLTPKGMHILQRFCLRNGIQQDHVRSVLESPRNTMKLVILEREPETDRLSHDQATVEVIFRRFVGSTPNLKADVSASDSDSLNEYSTGLVGVKMVEDRKIGDRVYKKTFTGKAATDWLMDCSSMVDRRETIEISTLFVEYGLIAAVDSYNSHNGRFQASKSAIYYVTERGQRVAGWISSPQGSINGDAASATAAANSKASRDVVRDSNTNRMQVIVRDPALRLLFREYLRHTHCEENLAFYLDVDEFLNNYRSAKRSNNAPKLEFIRETLAAAYSLYNAFLAPGSPCELNIDHSLRIALASRMTRAVGDDDAMIKSLDEVANLFDQAQTTVFKLMATDSVPKFTRDPKYSSILRERNLDFATPHATA